MTIVFFPSWATVSHYLVVPLPKIQACGTQLRLTCSWVCSNLAVTNLQWACGAFFTMQIRCAAGLRQMLIAIYSFWHTYGAPSLAHLWQLVCLYLVNVLQGCRSYMGFGTLAAISIPWSSTMTDGQTEYYRALKINLLICVHVGKLFFGRTDMFYMYAIVILPSKYGQYY